MFEPSIIFPFYRNSGMLERQIQEWNLYPQSIRIILVDDGSPEVAQAIIERHATNENIQLYRIQIDRSWNRGGARNLGAHVATTDWILQADIDHILPADAARELLKFKPDSNRWYRFPRWRVGKADNTRRKDAIPDDQEYGQIHPHVDSYLCRRDVYLEIGGYNEDFSGAIGGGNEFLHRLERAQPCDMLQPPIRLEVYTRSEIKDASDWSLPRDKVEYSRRKQMIEAKNEKPKNPLRFPWRREL